MVQGGGTKKKAAPENPGQPWCGYACVLDVRLTQPSGGAPPLEPPLGQYLDEVPMGMKGGVGDAQAQHMGEPCVDNVEGLQRVLSRGVAQKACGSLLWLAIGGIFGQLPATGLQEIRESLGQSWQLLSLALAEETGSDRALRDWIAAALPFVLAQAIFRIMVDGFPEDRKLFTAHAERLVNKISMVVHYEVTGFQANLDTVRRERRRLLLRHVMKNPHVNQREFLRGQKRQEMLESHSASAGDYPLRFGEADGQPLEETQLDHVMQARAESRRSKGRKSKVGPALSQTDTEQRVDRYAQLSQAGAELLEQQLDEFAAILGEEPEEAEEDSLSISDGFSVASPGPSPPSSPTNRGAPASWSPRTPTGSAGVTFRDLGASDDEASDGCASPSSSMCLSPKSRKGAAWRKAQSSMNVFAKFNQIKLEHRARKEREARAKKQRQEQVHRKIAVDSLPSELCERQLVTTWVSPCTKTLMPDAEDRNTLRKPSAEAFALKMATRPPPTRPLSMPALRAKSGAGQPRGSSSSAARGSRSNTGDAKMATAHETATVSQMSLKDDGSLAGGSVSRSVRGAAAGAASIGPGETGSTLPRVASASGVSSLQRELTAGSAHRHWTTRGEVLSLEPPQRLGSRVVGRRLEEQAKASKQKSFALYMKEYDIFTDMLKRTVDEKRLRDEEDACLRRAASLLDGPPKRRLPPESLLLKRRVAA
mmetsp:Transcript_34347/g.106914  ORF Transcript_34347/g.106914 Transcript_34347/m.106914 type:complete len:707 (+) Transcript_34347:84-2204(+)